MAPLLRAVFVAALAALLIGCGTEAPATPQAQVTVTEVEDYRPTSPPRRQPTPPPRRGCDPSYPTICIPPPPPYRDCGATTERNFPVVPPDLHGFDPDFDGIGCEPIPEQRPTPTGGSRPPPTQPPGCDPSYPTLCLTPGAPDLDCPDMRVQGLSGFAVYPPDPHRFDADFDGVGCE